MFTLYPIAFAPARKPHRIRLLFTHKKRWFQRDFCNRTQLCRADLQSWASHVGLDSVPHSGVVRTGIWTIAEVNKQQKRTGIHRDGSKCSGAWTGTGRTQTLSINCSGTMFDVCERLVPVRCRCCSHFVDTTKCERDLIPHSWYRVNMTLCT